MKNKAIFAALLLLATSCSPKLTIVHFNDTHSHIEPVRTEDSNPGKGGVIERAVIIDSIRRADGADKVLLLHAGDFNQGSSYYTTFGGTLEARLVNAFGYDCITLGNHEFDNGLEDLAARLKTIKCPVVCANIDFKGTPLEDLVVPCTIIEKKDMRIGIIGMAPDLSTNVAHSVAAGIKQENDLLALWHWEDYLHRVEKCDLIILLSHMGYDRDMVVAPNTHYVDIIVGGHSHTFLDDFTWMKNARAKKIPIIQDGCWGLQTGVIKVR